MFCVRVSMYHVLTDTLRFLSIHITPSPQSVEDDSVESFLNWFLLNHLTNYKSVALLFADKFNSIKLISWLIWRIIKSNISCSLWLKIESKNEKKSQFYFKTYRCLRINGQKYVREVNNCQMFMKIILFRFYH